MHRLTKTNSLQLHFLTLLLHDNFYKWACIMQNEWGMEGMVGQESNCKLTEEKIWKKPIMTESFWVGLGQKKLLKELWQIKTGMGKVCQELRYELR